MKNVYYVYLNSSGMMAIAALLASQGEIGGRETTELEYDGKRYPALMLDGEQVAMVRDYIRDNRDIVTTYRLFVRRDGPGKSVHDVTFMLKYASKVRRTVTRALATRGKRGTKAARANLVRTAK